MDTSTVCRRSRRELIDLKRDLIVAASPQPSRAAGNATSTIPIVFLAVADPVRVGLVDRLAQPGGSVTGVATLVPGAFIAKSLEVFVQALPKAARIAVLLNPSNDVTRANFPSEALPAARHLGVQLRLLEVRVREDMEPATDAVVQAKADAPWVVGDPLLHSPPQRIPDLALRAKLPTMHLTRELIVAGGLLSYGPDLIELNRRGAVYIDKILRGAKPADLPVEQPTKFRLVVNLKTAKAPGLTGG